MSCLPRQGYQSKLQAYEHRKCACKTKHNPPRHLMDEVIRDGGRPWETTSKEQQWSGCGERGGVWGAWGVARPGDSVAGQVGWVNRGGEGGMGGSVLINT